MKLLVSYLLFGYNHERFIEEALESAVAQDYEPMEIIVSDDGSTDRTANTIERFLAGYAGPKTIRFRKNTANLGFATTFNNTVDEAKGEVIVGAAGDDISCPDRVTKLMLLFADEAVMCAFSNADVVDEHGVVQRLHYQERPSSKRIASFANPYMGLLGATAAYRRQVLTVFGPLSTDVVYEDRVLPLRAAIVGQVAYCDERLIFYRRHNANVWNGVVCQFEQRADWERHEAKVTRNTIPVVSSRLCDIDTGLKFFPDRSGDLTLLRLKLELSLHRLQVQLTMFEAGSGVRKAPVALRHILSGKAGGPSEIWGFIKRNFLTERYFENVKADHVQRETGT